MEEENKLLAFNNARLKSKIEYFQEKNAKNSSLFFNLFSKSDKRSSEQNELEVLQNHLNEKIVENENHINTINELTQKIEAKIEEDKEKVNNFEFLKKNFQKEIANLKKDNEALRQKCAFAEEKIENNKIESQSYLILIKELRQNHNDLQRDNTDLVEATKRLADLQLFNPQVVYFSMESLIKKTQKIKNKLLKNLDEKSKSSIAIFKTSAKVVDRLQNIFHLMFEANNSAADPVQFLENFHSKKPELAQDL